MVAALRDEVARLKGGPGRPNTKPERHGSGEASGKARRPGTPEREHAVEAYDRRGADNNVLTPPRESRFKGHTSFVVQVRPNRTVYAPFKLRTERS